MQGGAGGSTRKHEEIVGDRKYVRYLGCGDSFISRYLYQNLNYKKLSPLTMYRLLCQLYLTKK